MTKKYKFEYIHGDWSNNAIEEVFEFEDDITEDEVEKKYGEWLLDVLWEKCMWYEVDEEE